MDKQDEKKLEKIVKEQFDNVRTTAMLTGAKTILKVVVDMCNEKGNDTVKINKIRKFCETGLGGDKEEQKG